MIYYDSHQWCTLIRLHGSVLPKAMLRALPSAACALGLKYLEQSGAVDLHQLEVLSGGNVYAGFMYILGFSLVFRTSQSYTRYWTAATAVHDMGSAWCDACASLIALPISSKAPPGEILRFRHTLVRLFSLLSAMALSEIASIEDDLPVLDVGGLSQQHIQTLGSAQGRRVLIALSWVKAYVTQAVDAGILDTPAPLIAHVYSGLGKGLLSFRSAQQVVIWPFPFPYTQMTVVLIQVYSIITPVVVSTWETWPWLSSVITLIVVTCMNGLDLIASELENPFGDDPNDLPVVDLQWEMNHFLTLQLNPIVHYPPDLSPSAMLDHQVLDHQSSVTSRGKAGNGHKQVAFGRRSSWDNLFREGIPLAWLSLGRYGRTDLGAPGGDPDEIPERQDHAPVNSIWSISRRRTRMKRTGPLGQVWRSRDQPPKRPSPSPSPSPSDLSMQSDPAELLRRIQAESFEAQSFENRDPKTPERPDDLEAAMQKALSISEEHKSGTSSEFQRRKVRWPQDRQAPEQQAGDWNCFLTALHQELAVHFDKQLEMQRHQLEVQRRELSVIEELLTRPQYLGTVPQSICQGSSYMACACTYTSEALQEANLESCGEFDFEDRGPSCFPQQPQTPHTLPAELMTISNDRSCAQAAPGRPAGGEGLSGFDVDDERGCAVVL